MEENKPKTQTKVPTTPQEWKKELRERFKIGEENKTILEHFYWALCADETLMKCSPREILKAWEKVWHDQIIIDNIAHSLITQCHKQQYKCTIHEVLKNTVAKICHYYKLITSTTCLSTYQVKYLQDNKLPLPENLTQIPLCYPQPTSILDVELVIIDFISTETKKTMYRATYTKKILLDTARKAITPEKEVVSTIQTSYGVKTIPATTPWRPINGSDSIEMLIKTAMRKAIKYFQNANIK